MKLMLVLFSSFFLQKFCYLLVSASTYTFMMMWEYSHYLLFVQAVSLFLLDSFALAQTDKVLELFNLLIVWDLNTASDVHAINTAQELRRAQSEWCFGVLQLWSRWCACHVHQKNTMASNVLSFGLLCLGQLS